MKIKKIDVMKKLILAALLASLLVSCGVSTDGNITSPSSVETSGQADIEPSDEAEPEAANIEDSSASGDDAMATTPETSAPQEETESEAEPETESKADPSHTLIADLNGNWIETGWQNAETYMICTVAEETIEIAWCMDAGETIALYWAGTAPVPTEPGDYIWDSVNDKEQTEYALLASGDDSKTFTYHADTDEITYSQSAMGMTKTVHLIRYTE